MSAPKRDPSGTLGLPSERAFTLKYNPKVQIQEHYYVLYSYWLKTARSHGILWKWGVIEFDSKGVLHLHGIVSIKKGFKYTDYQEPGFHTKYDKITNMKVWKDYCTGFKHGVQVNTLWQQSINPRFIPGLFEFFKPLLITRERHEVIQYYGSTMIISDIQKQLQTLQERYVAAVPHVEQAMQEMIYTVDINHELLLARILHNQREITKANNDDESPIYES